MKNRMKYWIAALCLVCGWAFAEVEQPHIAVIGRAEAEAVPDELVWNLSVKTLGANVTDVAATHAKEVSAVLDFLKTHVEKRDIRTQRMRLNENWVYRNRERVKEGFAASTSISFTSRDFSKYLTLWTGLSTCANTSIGGANFRLSNIRKLQNSLRINAVADARQQALALAAAGGVVLYEPIVIESADGASPGPRVLADGFSAMRSAEVAEPVEPGSQTVQAQVRVVYRIGLQQ